MVTNLNEKIRALVQDSPKSGFEIFCYTTSNIFTIAQKNISITKVLLNGQEITDYTFDATTNKITIEASGLTTSDVIEVNYVYTKYSNTEIAEYIKSALVFISVFSKSDAFNFELEAESGGEYSIVPTMDSHTSDLVALVASILIKPNYRSYKLPNISVSYPERWSKEEKIEKLIRKFQMGLGVNCMLKF